MLKSDAEHILNAVRSLSDDIGRIDGVISNMSDQTEKKIWVGKLGGLIGYLVDEIQRPIVQEYPDLDPYPVRRPDGFPPSRE